MSYIQKYNKIRKDASCACGCGQPASVVHHVVQRAAGGSTEPSNEVLLNEGCHTTLHSKNGDFRRFGRLGGLKTAQEVRHWMNNLKQFREMQVKDSKRWQAYYEYYLRQGEKQICE